MFSAVFLSLLLLFCSWNNQDGTRVQALRSMLRMQSPTNIATKRAQLPLKIAIAGAGVGGTVYISSRYFSNLWLLPLPFFRTFYSIFPSSLHTLIIHMQCINIICCSKIHHCLKSFLILSSSTSASFPTASPLVNFTNYLLFLTLFILQEPLRGMLYRTRALM